MGWNKGYEIFEATVIGVYDLGVLDKHLLAILMEPYRGTDIDSGGSHGLVTEDGKYVEQVVIETMGGKMPKRPAFFNEPQLTDVQREKIEAYYEAVGEKFRKVTDKFGWC